MPAGGPPLLLPLASASMPWSSVACSMVVSKYVTWCRHHHPSVQVHYFGCFASMDAGLGSLLQRDSALQQQACCPVGAVPAAHAFFREPGSTGHHLQQAGRQAAGPAHLHGGGQLLLQCLRLWPAAVCQRVGVQAAQLLQGHVLQRGASSHHLEWAQGRVGWGGKGTSPPGGGEPPPSMRQLGARDCAGCPAMPEACPSEERFCASCELHEEMGGGLARADHLGESLHAACARRCPVSRRQSAEH